MATQLLVVDNLDSASVTATISGSAGGNNSLYYEPWTGTAGAQPITLGGTLVGDGQLTVSPGAGYWNWIVTTNGVPANPFFRPISNLQNSIHYNCLLAIQLLIQTLNLSGSPPVKIRWMPRSADQIDATPAINVCPMGKELQLGLLNKTDDIGYPCAVLIFDNLNGNYEANLNRDLLWREKIFRALVHQPLALVGSPPAITVDAVTDLVLDKSLFTDNYMVGSGIAYFPRSRQTRGLT